MKSQISNPTLKQKLEEVLQLPTTVSVKFLNRDLYASPLHFTEASDLIFPMTLAGMHLGDN